VTTGYRRLQHKLSGESLAGSDDSGNHRGAQSMAATATREPIPTRFRTRHRSPRWTLSEALMREESVGTLMRDTHESKPSAP